VFANNLHLQAIEDLKRLDMPPKLIFGKGFTVGTYRFPMSNWRTVLFLNKDLCLDDKLRDEMVSFAFKKDVALITTPKSCQSASIFFL
jgi:hypothetical protein